MCRNTKLKEEFMSDKRKIVTNKDNEWLHPWGNERFTIGYVEEVNEEKRAAVLRCKV